MYRVSDQAAPLAALRVDVDAETAAAHETMRAAATAAANAHNRAIDLLLGVGDFVDLYEAVEPLPDGTLPPHDPGPTAPLIEGLCVELRSKQSPSTALDADLVRDRLHRLALIDATHPVAVHWRVLHARAYPHHDAPPAWVEIEGVVPAPAE